MRQVGDIVTAFDIKPLPGNSIAPPLYERQEYKIEEIHTCSCGQQHYHVGLTSKYNYVSCYTCKKELPNGNAKHWCHPSRFEEPKILDNA